MLHSKFCGYQSTGSGDYLSVFTIYGHGGHLGQDAANKLSFPLPMERRLNTKFGFDWRSSFGEDV